VFLGHKEGEGDMKADKKEPMPMVGKRDILPLIIEDLQKRDARGSRKYGTTLQSHNGRDSLVDAYQEALDLCMYLRQAICEREEEVVDYRTLL
jgi:hypothetical protein